MKVNFARTSGAKDKKPRKKRSDFIGKKQRSLTHHIAKGSLYGTIGGLGISLLEAIHSPETTLEKSLSILSSGPSIGAGISAGNYYMRKNKKINNAYNYTFSSGSLDEEHKSRISESLKQYWLKKKQQTGQFLKDKALPYVSLKKEQATEYLEKKGVLPYLRVKRDIANKDLDLTKRNANSFFRRGNPRFLGQFDEYKTAIEDAKQKKFSILVNPKVTGKTKMELLGAAVGTIEGKVKTYQGRVKDRIKDFQRGRSVGYTGQVIPETFEKYNLGKTSAIVGGSTLVGLGANNLIKGKALGGKVKLGVGLASIAAGVSKGLTDANRNKNRRGRW